MYPVTVRRGRFGSEVPPDTLVTAARLIPAPKCRREQVGATVEGGAPAKARDLTSDFVPDKGNFDIITFSICGVNRNKSQKDKGPVVRFHTGCKIHRYGASREATGTNAAFRKRETSGLGNARIA
jgi:hypothetical protein